MKPGMKLAFLSNKVILDAFHGQRRGIVFVNSGNGDEKNIQHKHYRN